MLVVLLSYGEAFTSNNFIGVMLLSLPCLWDYHFGKDSYRVCTSPYQFPWSASRKSLSRINQGTKKRFLLECDAINLTMEI